MSLKIKIQDDMKNALRAGDKFVLGVLRMVLSEMKYVQSQVNVHQELTEEEAQKVVAAYAKKLHKSLGDFPEGEAKQNILREISVVEAYLPKASTPQEILAAIENVLARLPGEKNFGVLMKETLAVLGGRADGKSVSEALKSKLSP